MNEVLELTKLTIIQAFCLVGLIMVIGFILGIIKNKSNSNLIRVFGKKGVIATALIGTPVHEIGHMIMCILFFHKITKFRLLKLNNSDGVLGYVEHSYNKKNIYQRIGNFFIGIGPILNGIAVILGSMYFLLPESFRIFRKNLFVEIGSSGINKDLLIAMIQSVEKLMMSLFTIDNMGNMYFWIFVLIATSVSSHIALSKADIKGAKDGLIALILVLFLINIIAKLFGVDTFSYISEVSIYNSYILAFSVVALVFSLITLVFSYIPIIVKSIFR